MKISKLLAISFVASSLMIMPATTLVSQAMTNAELSATYREDNEPISPRYAYVDRFEAGVYPSSSKIEYEMLLEGIGLRSFSGTVVLYKQLSSGTYQKIKSESLNMNAVNGRITHSGSTSSHGSGKYRVTYSGTAYFGTGSESVEVTAERSY